MSKPWKVIQANGQRIDLERDGEMKEIHPPKDKANLNVFLGIRPDELVDDATIENFLLDKPESR
jgi:hypothetical protein